jgi:hypothetical protein
VVRVSGYRSRGPGSIHGPVVRVADRGLGSIPGATTFSEK